MAVGVHVVSIQERASVPATAHHVVADAAIASSSGSPTVKAFIEAEAALTPPYVVGFANSVMIVTYDATALNSA
jgi:hypothetical protein